MIIAHSCTMSIVHAWCAMLIVNVCTTLLAHALFYDYSTRMYHAHSACMHCDHSKCMYRDQSICMYYDHSTCMFRVHSACIFWYSAHVRRSWDRRVWGAKTPCKSRGGGGPQALSLCDPPKDIIYNFALISEWSIEFFRAEINHFESISVPMLCWLRNEEANPCCWVSLLRT